LALIFPNCETLTVDFHEWLKSRSCYDMPHLKKLKLRVSFDNQALHYWYSLFVALNSPHTNVEMVPTSTLIEIPTRVTKCLTVIQQYWSDMKGFSIKKLFSMIIAQTTFGKMRMLVTTLPMNSKYGLMDIVLKDWLF